MMNPISLPKMNFNAIKVDTKVKSTMSFIDGIIVDKDDDTKEIEIEWSLYAGQTSRVRKHVDLLKSVVII